MALLSLAEASKVTGKNPSTLTRAVQKGKISVTLDDNNQRMFDVSELERVFGKLQSGEAIEADCTSAGEVQSTKLHDAMYAMHEREIALMKEQIQLLKNQLEDVRQDREHWRLQAERSTLLLQDMREKEAQKGLSPTKVKNPRVL